MPPKYSDSVRQTVETCLRAGVEPLQIASEVHVFNQWVYQLRQFFDAFGTVFPPHLGVQGRPRKVTADVEQGLLDFFDDNPSAYQDEMVEFLFSEFGISVTQSTVSRLLKKLNQIHKCTEHIHIIRDDELWAHFRAKICTYQVNQFVFVNELADDKRTKDRKRGWSLKGFPYRVQESGKHLTWWTILLTMKINEYIDYEIIQGRFNAETFNLFIQLLLRT
jgi:transposase